MTVLVLGVDLAKVISSFLGGVGVGAVKKFAAALTLICCFFIGDD